MNPLAYDFYCGLGGWTEGLLSAGFDVIGFDIERHDYGTGGYPAQLVLQDVRTIHGAQLIRGGRIPSVLVASPPCQKYSYMAMPWKKAKALAKWYRESPERIVQLNELFDACFRIQREACEAAGRYIPLIVENVKGATPWVGQARCHFGSFYLWGDVPALMPLVGAVKVSGQNWRESHKRGEVSPHWSAQAIKQHGSGREWFAGEGKISRVTSSKSPARKAASAQIAKIPFPLAQHIAKCFCGASAHP